MQIESHYFVFMAWVLFGGTHLLLSGSKLRNLIVRRLEPRGFTFIYALITVLSLSTLILVTANFGHLGRPGINIQDSLILNIVSVLGTLLIIAGLLDYPVSPMATLAQRQRQGANKEKQALEPPTSLARLTRHPFFVGLVFLMTAQTLRAPTLAIAIYYGGFVILASLGIYLQDRKLKAKWPTVYGDYIARTQAIPLPLLKFKLEFGRTNIVKWCIAVAITALCVTVLRPIWSHLNGAAFGILILAFGTLATLLGIAKSAKRTYSRR